jgi:hypothetical protein
MKPEALRAFIKTQIPRIMQRLEKSRESGHLVYPDDIYLKATSEQQLYEKFGVTAKDFYCFYSNSTYFEAKKKLTAYGVDVYVPRLYQLKNDKNLSDGLNDIIDNSTTVIDCLHAINIAWALCIEALLIECYGIADGKNKFNRLLNSVNHPFILSTFDVNQHTGNLTRAGYFTSVPLLSYFIEDIHSYYDTAKADPNLVPGARITINNYPTYKIKHTIGSAGAINLICVGNNAYMGFGLGHQLLTEDEVYAWLKRYHDIKPIEEEKPWLMRLVTSKRINQPAMAPQLPGYRADCSVQLDIDKLVQLTESFEDTLREMDLFIANYQYKQLVLFKDEYSAQVNSSSRKIDLTTNTTSALRDLIKLEKNPHKLISHKKTLAVLEGDLAQQLCLDGRYNVALAHYQQGIDLAKEIGLRDLILSYIKEMIQAKTMDAKAAVKTNIPSEPKESIHECKGLLFVTTALSFSYDEKTVCYWALENTETKAKEIAELLNKFNCGLKVSFGKIKKTTQYPDDKYRIVVESFDPKSISLNKIADTPRFSFA